MNFNSPLPANLSFQRLFAAGLGLSLLFLGLWLIYQFDPSRHRFPVCAFYYCLGLHCPGCGATRALHHLSHGDLLTAARHNLLAIVVLPYLFAIGTRDTYSWLLLRPPSNAGKSWLGYSLLVIITSFFVLRNIPLYPFNWLAPPGG